MRVTVRYFASIREALDLGQEEVDTQARTVSDLRDELLARGEGHAGALARTKVVRIALNQVMTDESACLSDGCELAFFPPVTGG
jgi:molybdopterin synthase sulfur carrier subunit